MGLGGRGGGGGEGAEPYQKQETGCPHLLYLLPLQPGRGGNQRVFFCGGGGVALALESTFRTPTASKRAPVTPCDRGPYRPRPSGGGGGLGEKWGTRVKLEST